MLRARDADRQDGHPGPQGQQGHAGMGLAAAARRGCACLRGRGPRRPRHAGRRAHRDTPARRCRRLARGSPRRAPGAAAGRARRAAPWPGTGWAAQAAAGATRPRAAGRCCWCGWPRAAGVRLRQRGRALVAHAGHGPEDAPQDERGEPQERARRGQDAHGLRSAGMAAPRGARRRARGRPRCAPCDRTSGRRCGTMTASRPARARGPTARSAIERHRAARKSASTRAPRPGSGVEGALRDAALRPAPRRSRPGTA